MPEGGSSAEVSLRSSDDQRWCRCRLLEQVHPRTTADSSRSIRADWLEGKGIAAFSDGRNGLLIRWKDPRLPSTRKWNGPSKRKSEESPRVPMTVNATVYRGSMSNSHRPVLTRKETD